jgi:hypothetical protein
LISERITRTLWAEWPDIPSDQDYGDLKTRNGLTIARHLAARQWPGRSVSQYPERPDDSYPTGMTDKPDGRWKAVRDIPKESRTEEIAHTESRTKLMCPVCRVKELVRPARGRMPTFCSNKCRMQAARA